MEYRVSVDTGGTFTDVVVTDSNGNFTVAEGSDIVLRCEATGDANTELSVEESIRIIT